MIEETVRRTFNINNFESLTLEGSGRSENPRMAVLLAERDCLVKAQASMVRIFNNRKLHEMSNDYDGLTYSLITNEISWVDQELSQLNR